MAGQLTTSTTRPRRGWRALAAGAALAATALSGAGCGSGEGTVVNGVKLVKKGELKTCTHAPYVPFQFEQSGKIVGFDVDVIDLVAKKLGVTQRIVDTAFETIKTGAALNSGKCDLAAAGMSITAERAKHIDFTQPYFKADQSLMAAKDSGITTLADVKAKKLRLGSQAGTTGDEYVKKQGYDPKAFESSQAELDGLRTQQADVIVQDEPVVRFWLKDPVNAKYALVANLKTAEQYGFAVRKGYNPKLIELINQTIDEAKRNGSYQQIYEKWMGPMPAGATP